MVRKRSRVQSSSTARKARITCHVILFSFRRKGLTGNRRSGRQRSAGCGDAQCERCRPGRGVGCQDAKCGDARWGGQAAEMPNAETHAGVRRPPRRRVPCGSLRKGRPLQADEKRQNKQSEARLPPNQPILRPKWTIQADRLP